MTPTGDEQCQISCRKKAVFESGDAASDALLTRRNPIDSGLARVVDIWGELPGATQNAILALIESALNQ